MQAVVIILQLVVVGNGRQVELNHTGREAMVVAKAVVKRWGKGCWGQCCGGGGSLLR